MRDYPKLLKTQGLELLEDYKGCKQKHEMRCLTCEGVFNANILGKIQNYRKYGRSGCPHCYKDRLQSRKTKNIINLINEVESNGYVLLSEFKGEFFSDSRNNTRVKKIDCGHEFETSLHYLKKSHFEHCRICWRKKIRNEDKLLGLGFVQRVINNIKYYDKGDVVIFIHDINRIQEQQVQSRKWMLDISSLFEGRRILHFYSDEFEDKYPLIEKKIIHILGLSESEKVYARQCEIRQCLPREKREFLNKFHIQGNDVASICYGAYHNGILIALMTFCKPRVIMNRKQGEGEMELSRFATNDEYRVVGIASRLLTRFIRDNPECTRILTYSDNRWSVGNLYNTLGFEMEVVNKPSYFYVIDNKRHYRWNFRKDALKRKYPESFDPTLTEYENMLKRGIDRVWDCGNIRYSMEPAVQRVTRF